MRGEAQGRVGERRLPSDVDQMLRENPHRRVLVGVTLLLRFTVGSRIDSGRLLVLIDARCLFEE